MARSQHECPRAATSVAEGVGTYRLAVLEMKVLAGLVPSEGHEGEAVPGPGLWHLAGTLWQPSPQSLPSSSDGVLLVRVSIPVSFP